MRRANGGWPRLGVSGVFLASRQADLRCGLPVCYLPCLPKPYLSTWPAPVSGWCLTQVEGRKGRSCVRMVALLAASPLSFTWLVIVCLRDGVRCIEDEAAAGFIDLS